MENLIEKIESFMLSDDNDRDKNSDRIKTAFENSDKETQEVIDGIFMSLCGWKLSTIINEK